MDFTIRLPFLSGKRESVPPVLLDDRQQAMDNLHGVNYAAVSRGNVYIGNSASAGIALIVPATTGGHPTLVNPVGSGVNLSLIKVCLGYVSGNNAPTCIEWALTSPANAPPATASPILTATKVAAQNALLGASDNSKAWWSPTTNTFTAAPVFCATTGLSLFTGVAATAVAPFQLQANYNGDLVIKPGAALSLCTQAATTTALFQVTVVWEEIAF